MKYLIGIDGGGTYARLLAVDVDGNIIGTLRGKSTSLESNSTHVVIQNLSALLDEFVEKYICRKDNCLAICLGTAGVDTQASLLTVERLLLQTGFTCPMRVVNDAQIALYANTRGHPGIILIAGTGSIVYGMNMKKKSYRVGGFGYIVGDEGSAYWVVKEAIQNALHAYDRTGPQTRLVNDFCKTLGFKEFEEIIDFVYHQNKSDLAKLSHVVVHAQSEGDPIAKRIMNAALEYFEIAVSTVVRELDLSPQHTPIYIVGGFINNVPWLRKSFIAANRVAFPDMPIHDATIDAEWGAVYMAKELAGLAI